MGLGWPAALLGLVAVAAPLLIHLLQRGEYRRVEIATTQFLTERRRLRWRRLKISQPWLLALRIALVGLCVLLLAEPYSRGAAEAQQGGGWTLVSPRVPPESARQLAPPGSELRWLARDFAPLQAAAPAWQAGATWSLLADADRVLAPGEPLNVIAARDSAGLSTYRPALSRAVNWIAAPAQSPVAAGTAPIEIDVVIQDSRREDAARIQAALAAWQDAGLRVASRLRADTNVRLEADYTIWLSDRPIPTVDGQRPRVVLNDEPGASDGAQIVGFTAAGQPALLERRSGALTVRTFAGGLGVDDAATADEDFARRLLSLLLGGALTRPPPDYPVSPAQLSPPVLGQAQAQESVRRPWTSWLVLLVLGAALAERLASAWTMERRRGA